MTVFPRRLITLLVSGLFAGGTLAQAAVDDVGGVFEPGESAEARLPASALRVERRFNLLARKTEAQPLLQGLLPVAPADDPYPVFLVADRIEGQIEQLAEGNVELRKAGQLLFADKVRYRPHDDEVQAEGRVRLEQDGATIGATYLQMKLSERLGFADEAHYVIAREVESRVYEQNKTLVTIASVDGSNSGAPMMLNVPNVYGLPTEYTERRMSTASGEAARIDFEGQNQIRLSQTTYSTCQPGQTDWYLKADQISLDYDDGLGTARSTSLWFQGVPLFYAPAAWFPINQQRRSGILSPTFKQSTRTGFDFTLPYYWNIAPNYDATFFPRFMGKRGFQLGVEARYMDTGQQGEIRTEYMPDDDIERRKRYAYAIKHQQNFGRGFSGSLNWNGVSDDLYWEDLSSRLMQTSQTQLPRQAVLSYVPSPWLQSSLQVLRYQTLQPDPENLIERPYFLEPQINFLGYRPDVLRTDLSVVGQYSRFTHVDQDRKDRGDRFVLYPQVSLPIVHPAFQILPKVGLHMSSYAIDRAVLNGGQSERISRVLPTFTLDSTLVFEREDELLGNAYVQTLEPRLYYVYIPYKDQSRIPLFDTGLSDFNFAQMFSENRYSGYDRINDAHQLTAALTTRILDGETGAERFKAMIGQRYYFEKQRVAIAGESDRPDNFSNVVAAINGLIAPKTYGEAAVEYNYRERTRERLSAGVRFQPDIGKVLSASYRYTRDPLNDQRSLVEQVDISGQWPIAPRWYAVGRYNYSLRDSQALETIGGIEYNAGCWAVRAVAQRLTAVAGTPNNSFFLQLELNDFASIGSNPLGLLRRSIPGYGKTNELPSDNRLIAAP